MNLDEQQLTFIKKYPHFVANHDFTEYNGFFDLGDVSFHLHLIIPNYPSLNNLTLECSWNGSCLLKKYTNMIKQWTEQGSLLVFLDNLKLLLMKEMNIVDNCKKETIGSQNFKILASHLKEIGFENISYISSCLSEIQFQVKDKSNRIHSLDVSVGKNCPQQSIHIQATLPECSLIAIKNNIGLEDIFKSFVEHVSSLQPLWDALDLVDTLCVLDPENPTRKDISRRVVIDKNVSLYLIMNINDAHAMPSMTFLGPEQCVEMYQSKMANNRELWDPANNILDNLKLLLEVDALPSKKDTSEQESLVHQGECCICFTMRLDDNELPAEVCDNHRCASVFHSACLFEWLQSTSGNHQNFNRIYGACPNCGVAISCPILC